MSTKLTVAEVAKTMGKGENFILAIIKSGELEASDVRMPGSARPRWQIDPQSIERFYSCRSNRKAPAQPVALEPSRRRRAVIHQIV